MRKEIKKNILEILKTCPIGTELYTPLCGKVKLHNIFDNAIEVINDSSNTLIFNEDGSIRNHFNDYATSGECLLFPDKYDYDWKHFEKRMKFSFKMFDKVVARKNHQYWHIDFYERFDDREPNYPYICMVNVCDECVPYNEKNAKLIGTRDDYED